MKSTRHFCLQGLHWKPVKMLFAPPHSQPHTSSKGFWATERYIYQLPAASSCSALGRSGDFLTICVSDLLQESPEMKRPRLPSDGKMHMEGWKEKASHLPGENARSTLSLGHCIHHANTVKRTSVGSLRGAEPTHCRLRRDSSVRPPTGCPSPSGDTEASTSPQPANIIHRQHQHLNQETCTTPSQPFIAAKECLGSPPLSSLPPKKRYTRNWCLQNTCCKVGNKLRGASTIFLKS